MWFRNAQPYRLTKAINWQIDELEQQLEAYSFTPATSQEISKLGFVKALGNKAGVSLVHAAGDNILIAMEKEEKMLPAAVIREELDERVSQLEAEHGRPARKAEKDALKEDIIAVLLPRAFSRRKQVRALIMPKQQLILVDCSSANRAEELLSLLRQAVGSLPVAPLMPNTLPEEAMTDWVRTGRVGNHFEVQDEAELKSLAEAGGSIKLKDLPLDSDEVRAYLDSGLLASKLGLDWSESINFLLHSDLSLKRLKFADVLQEQNEDIDKDDLAARLDADFALMCGEFEKLWPNLLDAMGGVDDTI
ncbi:recombination-associated protein RdgC [Ferrimonas lipolytica]|uniref:Recombination-associated protein RdgC n=1 Tax=Ferrimonas lipolytica TaxID=2724191 RepID=A0A6H1UD75_9GAMM|nr:recombination-associated protein RdgC [Ferrimonas lipolytica]QIZ77035.1 recombination-associated protein RdgC [Ferrimonas lipolytica]